MTKDVDIHEEKSIRSKILIIRGQQVMLDRDLAELYGVETKVMNQAVKRNKERFPEEFFFQLTKEEIDSQEFSRSQIVTLKKDKSDDKRAEYYAAHLLNHYTQEGTSGKNVPKVYQVSVLNFNLLRSNEDIVDWYLMRNQSSDTLADRLNIIFVYLKKLFRKTGDIEKLELKSLTSVEKWCIFFLCADKKEYVALVDELAQSEDGIMEAQKVLSKISDDELNWRQQRAYYDALSHVETIRDEADEKGYQRGYESGQKDGYNNGYDSGLEQGARENAIKNAISMLNEGDSPEKASRCTGLLLEEVQKLAETMKK